ncbi:MAG TPA: nucleoside-diphosphate sugar epimerase/dehydratase [Terriglobales bacterium]|nr:nucleoside-diphosphate sugar epimerase/dehydratase [Terriglobales bacterium]
MLISAAPILVLFRLIAMWRFNLLHGYWRFTGVDDASDIVKASAVGSLAFLVIIRFGLGVQAFPISVYVIEGVFFAFLLASVRLGFRILAEASLRMPATSPRKQVVIIGAGFAAQMIVRELTGTASGYWIVGCLDDDPKKRGTKIIGKPVLGTVDNLPELAAAHRIDEVLIAVPSASGAQMRRFVEACQKARLKFATVPSLQDLIAGRARIQDIRPVDVNDLLGRDPVKIDMESVRSVLEGQTVMVTGAAGSIGSELCRQILRYNPARLLCLDQNETGLFYLQFELNSAIASFWVADYTNAEYMENLLSRQAVQIIFHAAAYKHVPLMEDNPNEAIQNNVIGLDRFIQVADRAQCRSFVMISSDKAVNPSSLMGATKRIGELLLCSKPTSGMRCVSVRFGNVLGSQGSVIPVFQKQLAEQRRITVTHPDITRYFMTISEAVSLVLQASAIGVHRDILVLDMGEPIRITDLARTLIRLSGKSEDDVEIVYTGLRPGEKLYEELFYDYETVLNTECSKIKRAQTATLPWKDMRATLDALRAVKVKGTEYEIRAMVKVIVPEYTFGDLTNDVGSAAVPLRKAHDRYAGASATD